MTMRWALLLTVSVAIDAFSSISHQTTTFHGAALQLSTVLAYANVTDSAIHETKSPKKSLTARRHRRGRSSIKQSAATRRWNQRFEELRSFHVRHGHFEADEPKALTNWVRNQRTQYRYMHQEETKHLCFLTAERFQKLESLGFIWNPQEAKWKRMFVELVAYRDRFGHTNVPTKWKENSKLSQWASSQRFKYKARQQGRKIGYAIKNEQIDMLNAIGFSWDPKGQVWWSMYKALQEYKSEHGNCTVPQVYPPHPALGVWVRHLRRACRELVLSLSIEKKTKGVYVSGIDKERLEALRDIDFCWLPDPKEPWRTPPKDIFDCKG